MIASHLLVFAKISGPVECIQFDRRELGPQCSPSTFHSDSSSRVHPSCEKNDVDWLVHVTMLMGSTAWRD
jgi:hypothetical protein